MLMCRPNPIFILLAVALFVAGCADPFGLEPDDFGIATSQCDLELVMEMVDSGRDPAEPIRDEPTEATPLAFVLLGDQSPDHRSCFETALFLLAQGADSTVFGNNGTGAPYIAIIGDNPPGILDLMDSTADTWCNASPFSDEQSVVALAMADKDWNQAAIETYLPGCS